MQNLSAADTLHVVAALELGRNGPLENLSMRKWLEPLDTFWITSSDRDACVLCLRESKSVVRPGICDVVRAGFSLRLSARRVAFRIRGGSLVGRRHSPLVADEQNRLNAAGSKTSLDYAESASRARAGVPSPA